jgi:pterin-4a-carbinolamine dehydratase
LAIARGSSPHRAELPVSQFPGGAYSFAQAIGELAEAEGHHPNISFGWGNATVSLQTKKIKGLHENDFIMATKIDRIFARMVRCMNEL